MRCPAVFVDGVPVSFDTVHVLVAGERVDAPVSFDLATPLPLPLEQWPEPWRSRWLELGNRVTLGLYDGEFPLTGNTLARSLELLAEVFPPDRFPPQGRR